MGLIKGLPESFTKDVSLEEMLNSIVDASKDTTVKDGNIDPCLIVVDQDENVSIEAVPNGHQEMARYFTDKVEQFKGARAYIFVTESWTLEISTDDDKEVVKYMNNPDSIAENPFKEERLTFHAAAEDEAFEGYVEMSRDDAGKVMMGTTVIERAKEHFSNVADLLIPMVK